MSTFLLILGVVAAAVCVLWIALSDPDQPATIARRPGRGGASRWVALRAALGRRNEHREPEPATAAPTRAVAQGAPVIAGPGSVSAATPWQSGRGPSLWNRTRSALSLAVLVTFTGLVLAAVVGTGLALAVRAFTRAVQ